MTKIFLGIWFRVTQMVISENMSLSCWNMALHLGILGIFVPNFTTIHPMAAKTFYLNPQNVNLMVAIEENLA